LALALLWTATASGCAAIFGIHEQSLDSVSAEGGPGTTDAADGGSSYVRTVLGDRPVAYWRLDEQTTPACHDATGNGHEAVYLEDVRLGASGAIANDPDTAATFPGGYVNAGHPFAFGRETPFSVEAWIVRDASLVDAWGAVFSQHDLNDAGATPAGFQLMIYGHGQGSCTTCSRLQLYAPDTPIEISTDLTRWRHVVSTWDTQTLRLYVDAVIVDARLPTGPLAATHDFLIGSKNTPSGVGDYFGGTIDEVAIYDHALTPEEITRHYRVGAGLVP
jgi:hypothetical protein